MENNTEEAQKALEDTYQKIEESFSQFLFLLFIPNSASGYVEVYIDEGEHRTSMSIKEFLSKISKICGTDEMNRISVACNNLGIPFFYDREKKILKEVKEAPKKDRMCVSKIKELSGFGQRANVSYNIDSLFNSVKNQYQDMIKGLIK